MFITEAYAQAGGATAGADTLINLLPLVIIVVVFWFLIIKPQRTQMKRHQEMIAGVRRGDTVVTSGGIIGKVTKVIDEKELQVEIAEGVRVRTARNMVAEVRAKGEPVTEG